MALLLLRTCILLIARTAKNIIAHAIGGTGQMGPADKWLLRRCRKNLLIQLSRISRHVPKCKRGTGEIF